MATHLLSFVYSDMAVNREIIRFLSPVRAYLPWGAHPPEYADDTEIIISYPPKELRPTVDINLILGECYNWAYERGEKSRNEIIKTSSGPVSDESLTSIRNILAGRALTDASEKDMTIRWHLLLQLADRFEVHRKEANRMIEAIRKRRSPLFNHADLTDRTIYPLETIEGMNTESFVSDNNVRQLLKAWHSLFGGYIGDDDILFIIDRSVFNYLLNEYEVFSNNIDLKNDKIFTFKIPLLQENGPNEDAEEDILTIFSEIRSKEQPSRVMDLLARHEYKHYIGPHDKHILFTALYIDKDMICGDPLLSLFSNKIITHAEIMNHK
jgi:hypothetical protein